MDLLRRNTVGDGLRRAARLYRDRTALIFGARGWSFAALDRAADRVARRFADMGLRPGDRIAAYGRNSDAYLIAWLACARGGFVHVPVNYALTGDELRYILGQSGSRLVVAATSLEEHLRDIAIEMRARFEDLPSLESLTLRFEKLLDHSSCHLPLNLLLIPALMSRWLWD